MLSEDAEFLAAAAIVAGTHPRAAARLRAWAKPPEQPSPIRLRRVVLRRLWREHYFGLRRTAAARELVARWADWRPGPEPIPGTIEEGFDRLYRVGIGPVCLRTIISDLDPDLA